MSAFLVEFPGAEARIDRRPASEPSARWCTNRALRRLRDFELSVNGAPLLGWHDHPSQMWAGEFARPLVERLEQQRVLRIERTTSKARGPLLSRLLARLWPGRG